MARRTEEVKPLSETPNTKHQAPEKFRNRNTKNQPPNTKEIPSSKLQTAARASSLELGASLEFGAWNLELVAWALSFSHPITKLSACLFGQMTLKVSPMTALT